jgi:ribose transport system permease protein
MKDTMTTEPALVPEGPDVPATTRRRFPMDKESLQHVGLHYVMVWILIGLAILSDILYPGFFDKDNVLNILSQNAPVGLIAVGMTFVIIAGGFDLSVAAILAVGGVAFAKFSNNMPIGIAAVLAIAAGCVAGLINGVLITRLKINAFVATLGTASIFAGATQLYTDSQVITPTNVHFPFLGTEKWLGIQIAIWVMAVVFILGAVLLSKTTFGRSVYAIGGNNEAARLAGLRVDTVRTGAFVIVGGCAAIAGMILASRTGVGQSDVAPEVTLNSIAIVIIGGTSLLGGEGAMWRTLVGLLIFGTINNLFTSLAWPVATQQLVLGAILLFAVAADAYTRRRQRGES